MLGSNFGAENFAGTHALTMLYCRHTVKPMSGAWQRLQVMSRRIQALQGACCFKPHMEGDPHQLVNRSARYSANAPPKPLAVSPMCCIGDREQVQHERAAPRQGSACAEAHPP